MPARYAKNQRNRNASQRAGRRVGRAEARRVAEYNVQINAHNNRSKPGQGFPTRTTFPKGGVGDDGYNKMVPRRVPGGRSAASQKTYRSMMQKVLAEQQVLENIRKKKTKKAPSRLKQYEAPGWPDNTPTQRGLRNFKVL